MRDSGYASAARAGAGLDSYGEAVSWTAMVLTTMGTDYFPKTAEGRLLCWLLAAGCWLLALYAFAVFGGDLFTHVVAFSPGFMQPGARCGRPRVFVSHGSEDDVLPIGHCSRRLVPQLRRQGYEVFYREFAGPRTVPPDVAVEAVRWFTGTEGAAMNEEAPDPATRRGQV